MKTRTLSQSGTHGKKRLPRLLYLALAHHTERHQSRTIRMRFIKWEQRFCTRCSSQWLAVVVCTAIAPFYEISVILPVWIALLALLPLPALIDWITQTWGMRESTTLLRVATGILLGIGIALEIRATMHMDYVRVLCGFGVLCCYAAIIYALLKLKSAHQGYMQDLINEIV